MPVPSADFAVHPRQRNPSQARSVYLKRLIQAHRQRHRRKIAPFSVERQQCFGLPQQLRPGEHVEDAYRLDSVDFRCDTMMLLRVKSSTTISLHQFSTTLALE
jgi:hypothetical protein